MAEVQLRFYEDSYMFVSACVGSHECNCQSPISLFNDHYQSHGPASLRRIDETCKHVQVYMAEVAS
jgi:hypothetical protein